MSVSAALATVAAAGIIGHATYSLACSATAVTPYTTPACAVFYNNGNNCSATGIATGITWQWCCPFGCACGTGVHDFTLPGGGFGVNPNAEPLCVDLED